MEEGRIAVITVEFVNPDELKRRGEDESLKKRGCLGTGGLGKYIPLLADFPADVKSAVLFTKKQ
ncbi:MAG: hypothetical protein WC715_00375 [Patescibacteria group bacterium]|jgi:hypothetical protein